MNNRQVIDLLCKELTETRDVINSSNRIPELTALAENAKQGTLELSPINVDTFRFDPSYEHNPCIRYIRLYTLYEVIQARYSAARKNGKATEWLNEEFAGPDESGWRLSLKDALRAIILSGIGSGLIVGLEALFRFALNHPDGGNVSHESELYEDNGDVA